MPWSFYFGLRAPNIKEELIVENDVCVEYLWMDLIAAALDDRLEPDSRIGACLWSWLRLWPLLLEFLPVHLPEH